MTYQPLVSSPLRPTPRPGTPCLRDILEICAAVNGTTAEWLRSPSQGRQYVVARWVFYRIARERGYSLLQIGRAAKRHHSSVLHGITHGDKGDAAFRAQRERVMELLRQWFPQMDEIDSMEDAA